MAFGRDRDLYKTKLCTLYLHRGSCPRQSCSFAHGGAELRRMPGVLLWEVALCCKSTEIALHKFSLVNFTSFGHIDSRFVGLRSRFERLSPSNRLRRSHNHDRRSRGFRRAPIRDSDHSRSPTKRRRSRSPSAPELSECRRRDSKNARIEANEPHLSDVSAEDLGTDSPGAEKDVKSRVTRNVSYIRNSLEEQLAEVNGENKILVDQKIDLEFVLESKLHETTELSDKVTILDEKVAVAQEDCKGLASKTRKLIKVFKLLIRAQDDLKKAQAKLIKMVDDVIVESCSKNMDLNNAKVLLPSHGATFGDYATPLDGTLVSRKVSKVGAPHEVENRSVTN